MHEHNQDISVKLTAYLMGELDVAEAQEMERALADSAELRAEKARLESVIGLVREHGADDASLSREAHEAIASSAAGGKVHSITTHRQLSPMVNAASVLLLVGAAGALYVMSEDIAFTDSEVTELARAEGQAAVDGRMRESGAPNEQGLLAEKQAETKDKSGVQTKTVVVPKVEAGGASALVRGVGGGSAGGPGTPGPAGPSSPSPFDSSHFNSAIGIGGGGGGGGGVAGGKWGGRFGGRKASSQPAAGGAACISQHR